MRVKGICTTFLSFIIKYIKVVKNFNEEDVQSILDFLIQEDELTGATLPIDQLFFNG
jgi:hypothetical protein